MNLKKVRKLLIGKTITNVFYDDEEDQVTLELDTEKGDCLMLEVMCDPEGNHPGTLHIDSFAKGYLGSIGWR